MKTFSNDTLSKAINLGLIVLPIDKNDVNFLTSFERKVLTYQLIDRLITIQNTRRMHNTLSLTFSKYKTITYILEWSIIILIFIFGIGFNIKDQDFGDFAIPFIIIVIMLAMFSLINYIFKTICLKKNIVEGTLMIDELYNLNNTYYN